ncbi:glycosyltransferase [Thermicanus aegyptius]|uniref:glycosyltransferase n=1 Tax=Thermicanus aegyptius TaxID=94009 RepID=UPI00042336B4|nr:glycosyltransferase [Thermicanus aegyptius]
MRIFHVCSGFDINFNGGITNYVRSLADELTEFGNEVFVLDSTKPLGDPNFKFKRIKLEHTILRPFHLSSIVAANEDNHTIEKILKKINPDIIHVHMILDLPMSILETFKQFAPVIISLHDYSFICNRIYLMHPDGTLCTNSANGKACEICIKKADLNRYSKFLYRKLLPDSVYQIPFPLNGKTSGHQEKHEYLKNIFPKMDAIIAVSSRVKEIYMQHGLTNKKFIVSHIGNISATKEFRNQYSPYPRNNIHESITLGFIGYFSRHKGADLIIALADLLPPPHKIVINGRLERGFERKLKKRRNIYYNGSYQQIELSNILSKIDIGLVLPIWEDNAPQVVFEFLNAGIPIVGTKMGGIPDFIKHDYNGYLIEPSIEGIRDFLQIFTSENFLERCLRWAKMIKPTKTPTEHTSEILTLYKEIINK